MGRTSSSGRKGTAVGEPKAWPKEQLLKEAYELHRQRKKALALNPRPRPDSAGSGKQSAGANAPAPSLATSRRDSSGTLGDATKQARASLAAAPLAGETKDTGFKRPAKLQRKLDEIKENPLAPEEKPAKKRRTSGDEGRPTEEQPAPYYAPYAGGYSRGHLEEPVDGDYYPTTIFVGGLADDVEERDLERVFSRFGPIDAIRLISNKNFGFIKFRTPDACQASILGMNGEILNGSRVRVDRARVARPPWQRRPWGERRPYPPRDDGHGGGGDDYYRGGPPDGSDYGSGGGGGGGYMPRDREREPPYGLASLRGESTPVPFPPTPQQQQQQPYSAPPPSASSPSLVPPQPGNPPQRDRSPEGSPGLEADSGESSSRRAVQYDDL